MLNFYHLVDRKGGKPFSPYSWRILMALKHKNIDFQINDLTFTEIVEQIPKLSNQMWDKVPVITSDDEFICNSKDIAIYLDATYTNNSLFPYGNSFSAYLEFQLNHSMFFFKPILVDVINNIQPKDGNYFRRTREAYFNMTIEEFVGDNQVSIELIRNFLLPLDKLVEKQEYLEGKMISYSDYLLFGHLKMIQLMAIHTFDIVLKDYKNLVSWFNRIQQLYQGYASTFKP
ncbi:hypothetical protein K502DRAFT_368867 [Neoconidiobolus thromboides FSU 785]|nr:hypothetical protein K502DRAFT_368867 [Neoconidiobolus thromboides FSU 785]